MMDQRGGDEHSVLEEGIEVPSPLRVRIGSRSQTQWDTMQSETHTKKCSRSSTELDMMLVTEDSFQTVYDNSDTFKRKAVPPSSVATPETEESSLSYERPPRRKHKVKSKRRSSQMMMCGALGAKDEIVHDAKTTLRQIVTTLKKFGPDEKQAVRDTLIDSVNSVKGTLKKVAGQCSKP